MLRGGGVPRPFLTPSICRATRFGMSSAKKPIVPDLWTAEEVAEYLRVGVEELRRLGVRELALDLSGRRARKGTKAARWRFRRKDVDAWLNGLRAGEAA